MARLFEGAGGTGDQQDNTTIRLSAEGQDRIDVPGSEFIADSTMTREGQDLVLSAPDGSAVIIEGYFNEQTAPLIAGPHGASLSPELVNSFLSASPQYAQASTVNDESPVGAVEEMKGEATVTHADGTTEPLTIGSPIYQGDVIQTSADGAVNVVFADETSMAVSQNARMAIDEYTFDPGTESGTTNISVLRGVFVFTSGLIGRDDPDDVAIETPVGSIGIRGTIIAGQINPEGESEITVVEGAIVVKNALMEKTLSVQFETVKLGGMESDMQDMGVLDAQAVGTAFGSVSDVAPSLFSAINDAAKEQAGESNNAPSDAAGEDAGEAAPEGETNTETEAPQEIQMNDANPFGDNTFKEGAPRQAGHTLQNQTDENTPEPGTMPKAMKMAPNLSDAVDNTVRPPTTEARQGTAAANNENPGLAIDPGHSHPTVHRIGDDYSTGNNIGYEVTAIGDANNDGFADFMFSNNSSLGGQNHSYVVYGSSAGVSDGLLTGHVDALTLSLNDPDADQGEMAVLANPSNPGATNETIVRGIGDFDGDGVGDYLIGQQSADGTNTGSGIAYIVSGANPANYITLDGVNSLSYMGSSISSIGDVNNDGYADVIVGAQGSGSNGQAFILYGGMSSMGSTVDVTALGSEGYEHTGVQSGSHFGSQVVGIGDFDGDGYEDYAIGASHADYSINTDAGRVYIYSGASNTAIMNVTGYSSTLMTVLGLATTHKLGSEIFRIGDINGDGYSDALFAGDGVGNEAYVLFGGTNVNISGVNMSTSGFKIIVPDSMSLLGAGDAGDFNGDGYSDFAVAVGNGTNANIYVVYGNADGNGLAALDREFSLTDLNNTDYAFKMAYAGGGSLDFSISSAGDTNGDGYDDLVIGAANADSGYGEVIVIDGRQGGTADYVEDGDANDANPGAGVAASADGQSLVAHGGISLADDGNNDISFRGGSGDNTIYLSNGNFRDIDGGLGVDTIHLEGSASTLDFSGFSAEQISQVEYIKFGDSGQTITLTMENIFNMLRSSDTGTLKITYDGAGSDGLLLLDATTPNGAPTSGDIVDALNGVGMNAVHNSTESLGAYEVFDIGGYQLYIEDTVMSNAAIV